MSSKDTTSELREEILKYFGAYLVSAEWSIPPTEVADKIITSLTAQKQRWEVAARIDELQAVRELILKRNVGLRSLDRMLTSRQLDTMLAIPDDRISALDGVIGEPHNV